jgi:hypothetical protein
MTVRRASSVPAATEALTAALTGLLDGVYVGPPLGESPPERERVFLFGVEDVQRIGLTQQGARTENYVMPVFVEVEQAGRDSHPAVSARTWEIIDTLEQAIHPYDGDEELDGTVSSVTVESIPEVNVFPSGEGWISRAHLRLTLTAVI